MTMQRTQSASDFVSKQLDRRQLAKLAASLGVGLGTAGAMAPFQNTAGVNAQGELTLAMDAAATGGGGGRPGSPAGMFASLLNGGNQFEVSRMVDARLISLLPDLSEQVGDLAESWDIEDTSITFHLHPNAKWHDGEPVTSADVAFTLNLIVNPATTSRFNTAFGSLEGYDEAQKAVTFEPIPGIQTPDDHTVVLKLTEPDAGILVPFNFFSIMPQHLLGGIDPEKVNDDPFWNTTRIGAGPYKWANYVESERLELEAFEEYFLGAPVIPKVVLLYFSNYETSLAAFQNGSSLAAPMTANDVALVEGVSNSEIVSTPAGVGSILINNHMEEFADKRVRQAMSYAIDRVTVCEVLYGGYAEPVSTEIPFIEWAQPDDANPYDYDPEKAKALLAEAEWDEGKTYTLWYYYPDQVTQTVVEAIQQYFAAVGITVELRLDDGSGARTQEMTDGTWHLVYGSLGAQVDPSTIYNTFGPSGFKTYGYKSDEFEAAMQAGLRTYDQTERSTHYQEAIRILNEDLPFVWLFNRQNLIAVNSGQLNTGDGMAWGPGNLLYKNGVETWTITG